MEPLVPGAVLCGQRFEILRILGRGGMGVVYEVEDRERGERVALKSLKEPRPDTIFRLKREFRALADVRHPNLISLHELFVTDVECFFTMELVEGVDFLSYVTAAPPDHLPSDAAELAERSECDTQSLEVAPDSLRGATLACDEARLRSLLPQLTRGLIALHATGKTHRDVKASNLLVTARGRLVLLDFGLVADADEAGQVSRDGHVMGTVAYMAPEQCRGDPVTPAADWYAMGVLLYEALTGRAPFPGPATKVLMEKQLRAPAPPRAVVSSVPEDLDDLCEALLLRDVDKRPSGPAVLERLGCEAEAENDRPGWVAPGGSIIQAPFAGRDRELGILREGLAMLAERAAAAAVVCGASGIGKSTLVHRFIALARVERPDLVVFEGRCYERETISYQALDGLVDQLSSYWRRLSSREAAELVPRGAALLPTLFPVLGRVPAIAASMPARLAGDPQEIRTRAFAALREALGRLADRHPLLLFLDDLQWTDANTPTLLADLMRPPQPPSLLLVLASRPEGAERLRQLVDRMAVVSFEVTLASLPLEASEELARQLLGPGGEDTARRIAEEAAGNPLFISELSRHASTEPLEGARPVGLDLVLERRIAALSTAARRVLELTALAGEPVPRQVLAGATGLAKAELARELDALLALRLVRRMGANATDRIEPYHDRIRDAALARMSLDTRRAYHRDLAVSSEGDASAEQLALYWQGAGEPAPAIKHAKRAAAEALQRLDFDRAADLYHMTLLLGEHAPAELRALHTALGEALSHAGRPAEAAGAFEEAARLTTDGLAALELRRRSAEQLLRGGYVEDGLRGIRDVLEAIGLRLPSPGWAVFLLVLRRVWLRLRGLGYRVRRASELTERQLTHLDACWSVTLGLSVVDNIRSAAYSARHLALALRAGEPSRLARSFSIEAVFLASQGAGGRARLCVEHARTLADEHGDPYGRATATMAEAAIDYFVDNAWRRSLAHFLDGEEQIRTNEAAGWEVDSAQTWSCFNRIYLGELEELVRLVPGYVREAERRGDRYHSVNLRTRVNLVWLVRDAPQDARRDLDEAICGWMPGREVFQIQHLFALYGRAERMLYQGETAGAAALLEEALPALRRSFLLRVGMVDTEVTHLRARVLLAEAVRLGVAERGPRLRQALSLAGKLRRRGLPLARAWAPLVEAGAAALAGDGDRTVACLEVAMRALGALETRLYEQAARMRLGEVLGGETGAALVTEAAAYFEGQGVRNRSRMLAMLLPGWPHPDT